MIYSEDFEGYAEQDGNIEIGWSTPSGRQTPVVFVASSNQVYGTAGEAGATMGMERTFLTGGTFSYDYSSGGGTIEVYVDNVLQNTHSSGSGADEVTVPNGSTVKINFDGDSTTDYIDDIELSPINGVLYYEDFESYAVNAQASTISGWTADTNVRVQSFGGSQVLQGPSFQTARHASRVFTTGGTLEYDWEAVTADEEIRVYVGGVLQNTHTGTGSGSDSVTVADGQTVRFEFDRNSDAAVVDNLVLTAAVTGQTISLPVSDESETAETLTVNFVVSLPQVTESETTATLIATEIYNLAQVAETETAATIVMDQTVSIGQVVELETADELVVLQPITLPQSTELETAATIVYYDGLLVYLDSATETETAGALTAGNINILNLPQVQETETAATLTVTGLGRLRRLTYFYTRGC